MLRTLTTNLQHEARLAVSKLVPRRTFHASRKCLNESSPAASPPVDPEHSEAAAGAPVKEKKSRKKGESKEPKERKESKPREEKAANEPKPVVKSVLRQGKLLQQLRDIERPGQSISLEDVERYRPEESDPDFYHPEYPEEYKLRLNNLDKHFNKQQMYDVLKLYDIRRPNSKLPKKRYASMVLEQWGWPRPGTHDRTIVTRDFPLKISEALLLMMHESRQFAEWLRKKNVKVRIVKEPLALHAKGYSSLVEGIAVRLREIQQEIVTSTFSSPIKGIFSNDQLLQISKGCLAVAEIFDDGQITISYLRTKRESLEKTRRAVLAAAYEATLETKPPLYYHRVPEVATSSEPPLYSVLPFSPATTSSVSEDDTPTFRIERANGPVGSPVDDLAPVAGDSSLGSLNGTDQTTLELQQWLRDLKSASNAKLTVAASPGHVVVEPTEEKVFTISSPLPGQLELGSIVDWLRQPNKHQSNFHPFVPKRVFEFPCVSSRSVQRLVYSEADPSSSESGKGTTLRCEMWTDSADLQGSHPAPVFGMALPIENTWTQWRATCEERTSSVLDVLIPDRTADLRFTAAAVSSLKDEEFPDPLKEFIVRMRDTYQQQLQGDGSEYLPNTGNPPLTIYYQGKRFVLTSFKNVRVNRKHAAGEAVGKPLEVTTENVVDIDNNLTSGNAVCYVSCNPEMTEIQWEHFLKNCTWLTCAGVSQVSPPVFEEDVVGGASPW